MLKNTDKDKLSFILKSMDRTGHCNQSPDNLKYLQVNNDK